MIQPASKIAVANHFQVGGNNIHNLPGDELLVTGPGQFTTKFGQSVHAIGHDFFVLQVVVTPNPMDPTFLIFSHFVVGKFGTWEALQAWLMVHGVVSEGGQS